MFGENQSNRLQKLHNRAARTIANLPNETNQETALRALDWQPLKIQREKAKAKVMYKTLNNMGPKCLRELSLSEMKFQITIFVTTQPNFSCHGHEQTA